MENTMAKVTGRKWKQPEVSRKQRKKENKAARKKEAAQMRARRKGLRTYRAA
jgi:hypothetical protein